MDGVTGDTCSFCYVLGLTASVTHKGHNDPSVPHYFHRSVKIIIIRAEPARARRLQVYIRRPELQAYVGIHQAGRFYHKDLLIALWEMQDVVFLDLESYSRLKVRICQHLLLFFYSVFCESLSFICSTESEALQCVKGTLTCAKYRAH